MPWNDNQLLCQALDAWCVLLVGGGMFCFQMARSSGILKEVYEDMTVEASFTLNEGKENLSKEDVQRSHTMMVK